MTRVLVPLKSPPTARAWTPAGSVNGYMVYRAKSGQCYAQKISTQRWFRITYVK